EVVVERGREIVLPRRRVRRGRESPGRASAAARRQWPEERRHEQGATERPWDSPHVGAVYPRTRSRSMPPTEPSAGGGEFPWPIVHSVMTRRFVPTLAFAIPLLGLAGCDGKPDEDLPPAARRQAPPAETPSEKPATEEPPKKKLTEVRMDPVPAPTAAQFRKGVPARPGMSPDELRAYAEAQGDPGAGDFTMEEALAGAPELADRSRGPLMATFETTLGSFTCELYEDKAPLTVANFVGLARGLRASYDPASDSWVKKNFYDGALFHRVIEGFMVQTGDPTGTGMGGPGYVIVDEFAQD